MPPLGSQNGKYGFLFSESLRGGYVVNDIQSALSMKKAEQEAYLVMKEFAWVDQVDLGIGPYTQSREVAFVFWYGWIQDYN